MPRSDGDHDTRAYDENTGDRKGHVLKMLVTSPVIMIPVPRMYHSNHPV